MNFNPNSNFLATNVVEIKKRKIFILIYLLLFMLPVLKANAQEDINKVKELINLANDKSKPYTEIIKICDSVIIVSDKINYQQGKADALSIKGRAYLKLGEYPNAMRVFFEELMLREKNPEWENSSIGKVYNMIGESYRAVANYDLALEFLNIALIINTDKKDEKEIAHTYNRLAAVYYEMFYRGRDSSIINKTEESANKSLEISKKINDNDMTISSYNIIGAVYNSKKDYDIALKYFFMALDYADKDTMYADKPNILNNIASVYNLKKDYTKAIEYGLHSYELSNKLEIKIYIVVAAKNLGDSYSKIGDYQNAFKYLNLAYNLYIQIYDERKSAEVYGIQKKHETELAEKEERTRTMRRIIIGICVIFLIFFISVGVYYRHKQQVLLNRELAKKNELINAQKEELARSNAAKDKFFSILSHDMKNPLNGIIGILGVLDSEFENISSEEKKQYIGYLKASSESLYKLTDRLLIWSRLQRGRVEIKKERINLNEVISIVIGLQKANAIRKGIILENEIPSEIYISADRNVLDLVSRNLLDNAVKFTAAGGRIFVKCETIDNKVRISFIDTGVGISEENLKKIFLIEHKISTKGTNQEEGTGLGLVLCKEMLELIGITLKVESEKDKGSRFYFELPISK